MFKKILVAATMAAVATLSFSMDTEAGFGMPKIGNVIKKPAIGVKGGGAVAAAPFAITFHAQFSKPGVKGLTPMQGVKVYQVEYTDGGSTPIFDEKGPQCVIKNIKSSQLLGVTGADGNFTSGKNYKNGNRYDFFYVYDSIGFTYGAMDATVDRDRANNWVVNFQDQMRGHGKPIVGL
ncbi:MAG: hypothetical protein MJ055_06795 [Phascolarctobacterium sp.]|nr:hypothetical protein [Phascolarctobacterium sp.]